MTEFRVLPVRRGDACLIKTHRGDYLFDGGIDGCDLPDMLRERKVRKLRGVVCTTACRERLGGILDLMEAGWPVSEYWLPVEVRNLSTMARAFNLDWEGWYRLVHAGNGLPKPTTDQAAVAEPHTDHQWLEMSVALLTLGAVACCGINLLKRSPALDRLTDNASVTERATLLLDSLSDRGAGRWQEGGNPVHSLMQSMGRRFALGGTPADLALFCARLLLEEAERMPGGEERGARAVVTTLALVGMTAAMISRTSAKFRFFDTTDSLQDRIISGHPFKCLNGTVAADGPVTSGPSDPATLVRAIRHFAGHSKSLAFQYGNADCGVLFCGDSKLCFLPNGQQLMLDRPTVIVAPRQGGKMTERAYDHVSSRTPDQDIWVRGHYSFSRKIADEFKHKRNKLCLGSCRNYTLQEIMLRFQDGEWTQLSGGRCVCE